MKTSTPLILAATLALGIGTAFAQVTPGTSPPNPPTTAPSLGMPASGVIATKAEAYNRLEQQGYRDINDLAMGTDGHWHATALRGSVKVKVMVSAQGGITTN